MLTPKQMVLQTPARHELIDKEALFVFKAVANELYKIGVRKRSKVIHFSLHIKGTARLYKTQNWH
jgi:hypothetical protein